MSYASPLAVLLPKSVPEWRRLLEVALTPPTSSVWYPDHFYLHQVRSRVRYSPQKNGPADPQGAAARAGSAVLVLLSPTTTGGDQFQDMCITLTKRTTAVSTHKGQMSFPGGHREGGETSQQTAQREAREETGLDPALYCFVGPLTPIAVSAAQRAAVPEVAVAPRPVTPVCASPDEVDSIHYLHLSTLLLRPAETQARVIKLKSFSSKEPSLFPAFFASARQDTVTPALQATPQLASVATDNGFAPMLPEDYPGQLVWGLTSFMLTELTARLAAALEALHPGVEAAKAVNVLKCTNIIARDPDSPTHL